MNWYCIVNGEHLFARQDSSLYFFAGFHNSLCGVQCLLGLGLSTSLSQTHDMKFWDFFVIVTSLEISISVKAVKDACRFGGASGGQILGRSILLMIPIIANAFLSLR